MPEHIEGAVGDIDDAGDAEDQRQPGGDEEQSGRGGEPVERLKQEGVEAHRSTPLHVLVPLPARGRGRNPSEARVRVRGVNGPSVRIPLTRRACMLVDLSRKRDEVSSIARY